MAETTSRILALLNLLQTHRQWTGAELAERLAVTGRTLRRDIDRLRELGYRVEATRGAAGGYRLEAGAELPPLLLTDDEAVTMAVGLRVAATQGIADGEQTTLSALAKFEQVLPTALRQRVNALSVAVQSLTPRGERISAELLGQLALACRDHERIRFSYVAADGVTSERAVEPHSLVAAGRTWFFVCWDLRREDWRTFRVDRISSFFGTRVHCEPRQLPVADAAEFVAVALASLHRGRLNAEVVMRMPIEQMRTHFGPWATGAEAVDAEHTRWPIGGDSVEGMFGSLAWIPPGVEYELHGDEVFLEFVRETGKRLRDASER
ncbi:putative DNA-binding transcriptional regulator YafY [Glaciihabitans tibetensis]|uniref:Putative DNA-binding transcriptional regulator YafY n=1 Tax=Glaciihabitans tibetensis TaxID=1266600 RepID=A0A2T0VAZ0_9MICO|nr:YafY family protein [Glaciihabitans tibetensis]PRY67238.1 putative DNA-binding transcriptional regulator YafY [Glaciihabitans tibetensis]